MTSTYAGPSDANLRDQAITYLRQNKRREYSEMRRNGTLESEISELIAETRKHAQHLIDSGEMPQQAWYRAICLVICGRETD